MNADRNAPVEANSGSSPQRRRTLLLTDENPGHSLDYLNTLTADAGCAGIALHYVPDKLILRPAAFAAYLDSLAPLADEPLELLAITILEDINNEVVPRWVQVVAERGDGPASGHRVLVEDRQPKWDNPALLARLKRF